MSGKKKIAMMQSIFGITHSGIRAVNIRGDIYELQYFNPFFLSGSWPWVGTGRVINEKAFFRFLRVRDANSKTHRHSRVRNPSGRIDAHLKNENFAPAKPINTVSSKPYRLIKCFKIRGCHLDSGEDAFSGYQKGDRPEIKDGMVIFFPEIESLDKVYAFVDPSIYFIVSPVYED